MQALENIGSIQWKEKRVASGMAEHVPGSLAGLLSPDKSVRDRSYWRLDNEIVLQSDLYEAAYFTVPFLVEMLREKPEYGRDRIYDLLYEIANGDAPLTDLCRTKEGDEVPLKEACMREVYKGLEVFNRDLVDENPIICKKARELIELTGEYKST